MTTTDAGADTGTGEGDASSDESRISGNILYTGSATGPAVYLTLFADPDGTGNPPPTAELVFSRRLANPTFPLAYELSPVPPGTYVATAYLSVETDHGQGPVFETDPLAFVPVTVSEANPSVTLDITLEDPAPPEGDAGADADSDAQ